ncbi:MAG TPA: thioredoxin family protein [Verrucomicrobiae bacterium]|nr:thioredoxin family protein [Verrucomicrobiae bacterium]
MEKNDNSNLKDHRVVSHEAWLAARTAFLAKEKEFSRLRDELSRQRRELPWERVEKNYVFDGPNGKESLAQLFGKRSQLVVYHFMFNPESDAGCKHCSFWADNFNGVVVHMDHRDVAFVAISRAPLAKIEPFRKRMGWSFKWLSSFQNDFNHDYQASFTPEAIRSGTLYYNYAPQKMNMADREGASVFYKNAGGEIFHTYSTYARGIDMLNTAYHYLDLVPKGRDEGDGPQSWVRYHDSYKD